MERSPLEELLISVHRGETLALRLKVLCKEKTGWMNLALWLDIFFKVLINCSFTVLLTLLVFIEFLIVVKYVVRCDLKIDH